MKPVKKKKLHIPTAVLVALLLLAFFTGVLASGLLLTVGEGTPKTEIDIKLQNAPPTATPLSPLASLNSAPPMLRATEPGTGSISTTVPVTKPPVPDSEIGDAQGVWKKNTVISLFKAVYDNESGEITVRSAYGDKVIAPGTANSYYFDIRNTGEIPLSYTLTAQAELTFVRNGERLSVPIVAKFYDYKGKYLLGSADSYADMQGLDSIHQTGGLSVGHYARYTLEWAWPFEGNDELDTLIGSLAAEGDTVDISVTLQITAQEDPNAVGGVPKTGDWNQLGLWLTLGLVAAMLLLLLLFVRRREDSVDETDSTV